MCVGTYDCVAESEFPVLRVIYWRSSCNQCVNVFVCVCITIECTACVIIV